MSKYTAQVAFSLLFKALSILNSFLIAKVLFDKLGQTDYGSWATIYSLFIMAGFLNLGISGVIQNNVGRGDFGWQEMLAKQIKLSILISSLIFVVGTGLGMILNYPHNLVLYLSLTMFCIITQSSLSRIYIAKERSELSELVPFGVSSIFLLLIVGGGWLETKGLTLGYVAFCFAIANIIVLSFCSMNFWGIYREYYISSRLSFDFIKESFQGAGLFFLAQIAAFLLYQSLPLLIFEVLSPDDVAVFDLYNKFMMPVLIVSGLMFKPLWTKFNKVVLNEDVKGILVFAWRIIFMLFIVSIVVALLTPMLVDYLFGLKYEDGFHLSSVRMSGIFIQLASTPFCYYLNSKGDLFGQVKIHILSFLLFAVSVYYFIDQIDLMLFILLSTIAVVPFFIYSVFKSYTLLNRS